MSNATSLARRELSDAVRSVNTAIDNWKDRELQSPNDVQDHLSAPRNLINSWDSVTDSAADFRSAPLIFVIENILLQEYDVTRRELLTARTRTNLNDAFDSFDKMMVQRIMNRRRNKGPRPLTFYNEDDVRAAGARRNALVVRYGLSEVQLIYFTQMIICDITGNAPNGYGRTINFEARIDLISEAIKFEQFGMSTSIFYQYGSADTLEMRGLLCSSYQASIVSSAKQLTYDDSVRNLNVNEEPWGQCKVLTSPLYHSNAKDEKYIDAGFDDLGHGSRIITVLTIGVEETIAFREWQSSNNILGRLVNLDDVPSSRQGENNVDFTDLNDLANAPGKLVQYIQGGRDATSLPVIVETVIPETHHEACALNEALVLQVTTMVRTFCDPNTSGAVTIIGAFGDIVPVDLPAFFYGVFISDDTKRLREQILGYAGSGIREPSSHVARLRRFLLYCHIFAVILKLKRIPKYLQETLRRQPVLEDADNVSGFLKLINEVACNDVKFKEVFNETLLHNNEAYMPNNVAEPHTYEAIYQILDARSGQYYSQMT